MSDPWLNDGMTTTTKTRYDELTEFLIAETTLSKAEVNQLNDIDKALNWELWNGVLPDNYWTYVEPLGHYIWRGMNQAIADLKAITDKIPLELWHDTWGEGFSYSDPTDDIDNASIYDPETEDFVFNSEDPKKFDELVDKLGWERVDYPEGYERIEPLKILLHKEVISHYV